MKQWSEQGDTKLHFFAEKVLYNCLRSEQDPSLDDPIFMLYDGSKNTDVFFFFAQPHTQRIADIVFIHGLQGSFFSTWMVQQETSDFHHITCWPATYLPAYLANRDVSPPVRILSVSYHARMRKSSSPHPTLSIQEQAADLRKRLDSAGIGERPVIFVTHSLGGLIVKEMLVDESKWENIVQEDPIYADRQTHVVLFAPYGEEGFFYYKVPVNKALPENLDDVELDAADYRHLYRMQRNYIYDITVTIDRKGGTVGEPVEPKLYYQVLPFDEEEIEIPAFE